MNLKYNKIGAMVLLGFTALGSSMAFAQSSPVTGKVYSDVNAAIEGAIVRVDGTPISVVTDKNGAFEIPGADFVGKELVVEVEGYKTTSQQLKDGKNEVRLVKDVAGANEVIEIINDTRKSSTYGGAVSTISGDELRKTHLNNLPAALAGRVPGLYVRTSDSQPGSEKYSMFIRGTSTINGNGALILIDGIESGIYNVDINDVESVTVLKDAASTAQYGLQGSEGVILVKTKRGLRGQRADISANVNYSVQNAIKTPTILNSYQYAKLMNEASFNDGVTIAPFNDAALAGYKAASYGEEGASDLYPNNDWYNMFLDNQVTTLNANVNAIGGGEYVGYYISAGYETQHSPFVAEDAVEDYKYDQFNLRSNLDIKVNKYITGFVNVAAQLRNTTNPRDIEEDGTVSEDILKTLFDLPATEVGPLTPEGGVVIASDDQLDPTYGRLNKSGYSNDIELDFTTTIGLKFDLDFVTKGLSLSGNYNYNLDALGSTIGTSDYVRYLQDPTVTDDIAYTRFGTTENDPLVFSKKSKNNIAWTYNVNLDYDRVFGDHSVRAGLFLRKQYANLDKLDTNLAEYRMTFGALATYGYKDFLYADFAASYDGSEQFINDNRYGFYPSGAVSFVASNLDFLKHNETLTYLKLRASYGVVGNDIFGSDRFMYEDTYGGTGTRIQYLQTRKAIEKYGNKNLTAERSHKFNVGFDLSLLDQITLGVDYFHDRRTQIAIEDNLTPLMSGADKDILPIVNDGQMTNQGFDLYAGYYKSFSRDFTLSVNGNVSFYKNSIDFIGEKANSDDYMCKYFETGYRNNQQFGYEIDYSNGNGFFNTEEELLAYAAKGYSYQGSAPRLGDFRYIDQNNDFVIDEEDKVTMGETNIPQISWGAEVSATYKWIDFSVLFQGMAKYTAFNSGLGYYEDYNNGIANSFFEQHLNAWTQERYDNGELITAPALTLKGSASQKNNNYYFQDKSFARLKNIEIGFSLPNQMLKKANMKQLRIYANCMNAFTWDKMKSNDRDVEGGAVNTFPTPRYWNVGVNLTF